MDRSRILDEQLYLIQNVEMDIQVYVGMGLGERSDEELLAVGLEVEFGLHNCNGIPCCRRQELRWKG